MPFAVAGQWRGWLATGLARKPKRSVNSWIALFTRSTIFGDRIRR